MDSIKFDCYSTISFKASDPLSHSRSYLGAWWEVDLGEGVAVSRVIIYNRDDTDANRSRLSNSVVSLLNYQGNTLKTYRIGDATNVPVFDINFSGINGVLITKAPTFKPTAFPTASPSKNAALVHKVRVQLEGTNALHMREVQVYDTSGVNNRALNKSASQSSTYIDSLPYKAVNGDLNDYSHTNHDAGNVS
jgi:hypothetical protein